MGWQFVFGHRMLATRFGEGKMQAGGWLELEGVRSMRIVHEALIVCEACEEACESYTKHS